MASMSVFFCEDNINIYLRLILFLRIEKLIKRVMEALGPNPIKRPLSPSGVDEANDDDVSQHRDKLPRISVVLSSLYSFSTSF